MADIRELWTEEDWKYFEMVDKCKTSKERKRLIREHSKLREASETKVSYPHIDMSVDDFCAKYNLIERDDFKW